MIPEWRQTDRIRCLECGRWYRALPTHLRRGHAMTEDDYREAHNIPAGLPLVCLDWSDAQSRRNRDRGASRTLSTVGPEPGYRQRDYVLRQRRAQYLDLAAQGAQAARQVDRTADRRAALAPFPVTVAEAAERLGCSRQTAYRFLGECVARGQLRRIGRGHYDTPDETAPPTG